MALHGSLSPPPFTTPPPPPPSGYCLTRPSVRLSVRPSVRPLSRWPPDILCLTSFHFSASSFHLKPLFSVAVASLLQMFFFPSKLRMLTRR